MYLYYIRMCMHVLYMFGMFVYVCEYELYVHTCVYMCTGVLEGTYISVSIVLSHGFHMVPVCVSVIAVCYMGISH